MRHSQQLARDRPGCSQPPVPRRFSRWNARSEVVVKPWVVVDLLNLDTAHTQRTAPQHQCNTRHTATAALLLLPSHCCGALQLSLLLRLYHYNPAIVVGHCCCACTKGFCTSAVIPQPMLALTFQTHRQGWEWQAVCPSVTAAEFLVELPAVSISARPVGQWKIYAHVCYMTFNRNAEACYQT